jgi:hypothetical protein
MSGSGTCRTVCIDSTSTSRLCIVYVTRVTLPSRVPCTTPHNLVFVSHNSLTRVSVFRRSEPDFFGRIPVLVLDLATLNLQAFYFWFGRECQ